MGIVRKQIERGGRLRWENVEVEPYRGGGVTEGSCRQTLIGPQDGAHNFSLRYFEIPPHGQSSFEHHLHDHGVVILRGRARVLLGWELTEVGPGDVIYIAQDEQHQFENTEDEPLGFLCVNPSKEWLERVERVRGER